LIEMADSGVPPSVIDVVVAVSYPEKFVINEGGSSERRPAEAGPRTASPGLGYSRRLSPFADPFYDSYGRYGYSSFGRYGYGSFYGSRFGYGRGYGYSGYGLGYGGGYAGGYGGGAYGSPIIVVERRGSDSGRAAGRVVRGGGYAAARGSSASTGRSARPRSSGSSRSSEPAAASARSRSSGSSGSSGSSSSPPRSTGRRAQPRPNPGN
jgi:hypothetical protein